MNTDEQYTSAQQYDTDNMQQYGTDNMQQYNTDNMQQYTDNLQYLTDNSQQYNLDLYDARQEYKEEYLHSTLGTAHDNRPLHIRKALIMAGGFGTRLKELTQDTPKPMLLLQGRPILEYSIELCKRYGITEIALSIFHFGDKIKQYFGDGSRFGVHIVYVEENEPMGTGGALRLFEHWLNEPFMMCNADELKDINLYELYKHHMMSNALATIALTRVEDPSQYGVVDLEGNKIKRFVEKPKKEEAPSNFINAGLYIIEPEAIKFVPHRFTMVEKDLFPKLANIGRLNGFKFNGQWFDTGTIERYANTEKNWNGFHA
jgi:mannose-1-phosphate guanylyltransferase